MKLKHILYGALLLVLPGSLAARELSLQQALDLARDHSFSLRRAQAETEAARAGLQAAEANRWPTLSSEALAMYRTEVAAFEVNTGLATFSREIGSKENYQLDIQAALPLYTGGKISSAIEGAAAGTRYREAMAEAESDRVLFAARLEYLSLYRSERELQAARQSRRRAEVIARDVQSLHAAGAADSVDVLEAELAVARADLRVATAGHERRASEIRLLQLTGLPVEDSLTLTDTLPAPQFEATRPTSLARAELQAAAAAVDISMASVKEARASLFPTLSAFGGYSYGKPNIDQFNNTWNDHFTVGGRLTWSLNLGFREKHRINQKKYLLFAARNERQNIGEELQRESNLAREKLALAFASYQTARKQFELASQNYRLAEARHREGALSSNRLLEIEASYSEAEASLAAAEAGFFMARSAWYFALGSDKLEKGL